MIRMIREITEEIYNNAMNNNGYITSADEIKVFTDTELYGYGIYSPEVTTQYGKYYVTYYRGKSCD